MRIRKTISNLTGELIDIRRDLHMYPELGFEEYRTSQIVRDYLTKCGLEVSQVAKTGVVGLLKGKNPGPTLMLRADMDALPVQERNDVSYRSKVEGKMHACAHDGHVAMLLVAAKVLSSYRDRMNGNIKFVFQPNEEDAGARMMMEEGVMEHPRVDAALGIHLWTPLETGKIGVSPGPVMAGQDNFRLVVTGKGGHSGSPQTAVDPIIAAANIILAAQTIQTREINVLKPTLIVFGKIQAGSAPNVIPDQVDMLGSLRYLYDGSDDTEEQPKRRLERMIQSICAAYRTSYQLEFIPSSSPLINDGELAAQVKAVAEKVVGAHNIVPYVCMPGEDFAEFSREVPGMFYFIGTGNKKKATDYPHHHPCFNIDEDALPIGVEMHVRTALHYLKVEMEEDQS